MATTKKQGKTTESGTRELIAPKVDKRHIKRDGNGRVKGSDDQSRSLSSEPCRMFFDFEELP